MALVKFGQGVAAISGKIGGTIFSHNGGGAYARNFAIPTNPATADQLAARLAMTQAITAFNGSLTDAQRDGWATYAANVPVRNRLGDLVNIAANAWYAAANAMRLRAGLPRVDDAPTTYEQAIPPDGLSFSLTAATGALDVTFDNGEAWANEDDGALLIYASRPQNQTVNSFKGPFRFVGKVDGDGSTPPTSPESLSYPFTVSAGQKVFLRAVVSRADGRYSEEQFLSGDAV